MSIHSPVLKPNNIPYAHDNLQVRFHSGVSTHFDSVYENGSSKPNFTVNGIEYTVSGPLNYNPKTMNFECKVYDLYASRVGSFGGRDLSDSAKKKFSNEILPALSAWVKTQTDALLEANRVKTQDAADRLLAEIKELDKDRDEKCRQLANLEFALKTGNFSQVLGS